MASGDTIWELDAQSLICSGTNPATPDTIIDGSGEPIVIPVLDFDGGTDEWAYAFRKIPSYYDGGGFDWEIDFAMDGADGSGVEMELRIKVIAAATLLTGDLAVDDQTSAVVTDATPETTNTSNNATGAALSHANAGSPSVGDWVVLGLMRDVSYDGGNVDDLQLIKLLITET